MNSIMMLLLIGFGILFLLPSIVYSAADEDLQMVKQHCMDHASEILSGANPINDLLQAGLVSSWEFEGKTCDDITAMEVDRDSARLICELATEDPQYCAGE